MDNHGRWKVLLVAKDLNTGIDQTVEIRLLNSAVSSGGSQDLGLSPGVLGALSKKGITWAGHTFDGSNDGKPVGGRVVQVVGGEKGGAGPCFGCRCHRCPQPYVLRAR